MHDKLTTYHLATGDYHVEAILASPQVDVLYAVTIHFLVMTICGSVNPKIASNWLLTKPVNLVLGGHKGNDRHTNS